MLNYLQTRLIVGVILVVLLAKTQLVITVNKYCDTEFYFRSKSYLTKIQSNIVCMTSTKVSLF